jgi:HK97 family phage major capsid protein
MRYERIIAWAMNTPWAILDSKFDAICAVLARCEAGVQLSEEEIRERVGDRKIKGEAYVCGVENGVAGGTSIFLKDLQSSSGAKTHATSSPRLTAVIPVWGVIVNRVASLDISETGTGVDALAADFRKAMANPDVKTIVFDFDSPGGSVYGIDEFAQEIFDARGKGKKIIAQISPMCASAAYYLAAQCDEIVITPSGDVGSIGVRAMHQDLSKALEMRGIKITHISAGKYKTEGNPTEPLSEEGLGFMQQRVDEYYNAFAKAVARGRDVKVSDVKNGFGEGRVVGATEAKTLGMVDRIATLDETLARVGANASGQKVSLAASAAGEGSRTTATAENQTEVTMDTPTPAAASASVDAIRAQAVAESDRIAKITQLATENGMTAKLSGWLGSGASVQTVQGEILDGLKAQPIRQPAAEASRISVIRDEADNLPKGAKLGRFLRTIAGAHRMNMTPEKYATTMLKDKQTADYFAAGTGSPQSASVVSDGGFMIPENLSPEIIEFLRPQAVVRSLDPTLAPLVNGQLTLPKLTGGVLASYIGENKPAIPSQIKGGQLKATAKKLAAMVLISNDLLRYQTGPSADIMIKDDAVRAIAQVEDVSFIRAAGTAFSPKGLKFWAATTIHATAGQVLATVIADIGKLWLQLANANVRFIKPGFIFAPRTKNFLMNLLNANGQFIFRDELNTGKFMGYPYRVTPQIPINLNTGIGNESEIYFADFADVFICDAPIISVEVSTEAAIDDGAGNIIPIYSNDQSALRFIVEHDMIVRHPESSRSAGSGDLG